MKISLSNNKKSGSGSGCLTIFGLCFLIPGLLIGFFALKNLYSSLQASSWHPVQATILSADLKVNRGDDSTTYKATGKYSYQYEGVEYSSDKLYFGGGSDSVGSFHQDLVRDMDHSQRNSQTIQAWVNPKKPSESVLIKELRWSMFGFMMIFPLIFGGVGAGIIYAGHYSKKKTKIEDSLQAHHPDEPWMWKEEWQSYTIKSSNKKLLWFSAIFATFWCLISAPLLFMIPSEVFDKKNYLALIGLLFPLVGIGLASWAIRNYFQWKKFGDSELTLSDMPARLGRILRAKLHIPAELTNQDQCKVIIECVNKYTSGSGKNRSTRENVLWQDQQRIKVNMANFDGHTLPIEFKLPKDMPVSDWSDSNNEHFWRVRAEAKLPGVDYSANFIVPVFTVDHSNLSEEERYDDNFFAELDDSNSTTDNGDWQHLDLAYEQTVQGSQYTFDRARLKGMAFTLTLMAVIFGGIGAWLLDTKQSIFIGAIFSIFGFFITWGALHQWLHKSVFTVTYNKLTLRSGWFMTNNQEFQLNDIKKLYKHSSMSSGSTQYFGIYIDIHEKKKIKLAENLVGNRDVDSLIAAISDELGLKTNR